MEGDSSDTEEDYYKPDDTSNGDTTFDLSEIPQTIDDVEKAISEEQLDLTEVPQTVEDVEKAISEEQLDLSEIPQTVDDLEKEIKESEEQLDLTEIPQTVDEVKKAIKESEGQLDLTKIPQTLDEIEKAINEEQLDLSEIPKSIDELNALDDYQNKNIVENSIHRLMRMSPEQRERLGLSRGYTNHELNIFFAQNDPPSTLDINKAKPSEVSNPEGSKPISRNDSLDGKSEDLKKESVNKTTVKEMTPESDIKQKETSSTLNKDIEKNSSDNSKSQLAKIDREKEYNETKINIRGNQEKSERNYMDLNKENTLRKKIGKTLNDLIDEFVPTEYKNAFEKKANEVLDICFKERSGQIHKNTNFSRLAATIVYSIPKTDEKLKKVRITQKKLANYVGIKSVSISNDLSKFDFIPESSFQVRRRKINKMSEKAYKMISNDNSMLDEEKVLNIRNSILSDLNVSYKSKKHAEFFKDYTDDLVKIVAKLKELNAKDVKSYVEIIPFSRELKKEGIDLCGRTIDAIGVAVLKIIDHFKVAFPEEFTLERRGSLNINSRTTQIAIRKYKNKFRYFTDSFNFVDDEGSITIMYEGKCMNPDCLTQTDFKMLPSLEFHHNEKQQNGNYVILHTTLIKSYEVGKKLLETQRGGYKLLCRNCHRLKKSDLYYQFKDFLLSKQLLYDNKGRRKSAEDIIKSIDLVIAGYLLTNDGKEKQRSLTNYKSSVKQLIQEKVKKRDVIEQLYGENYTCIGCSKTSIKENLKAFDFHHTNPNLFDKDNPKTIFGTIMRKSSVKEMIGKLIEEECICLCSNCHIMLNACQFEDNVERIIGESYKDELKEYYENLHRNVKSATDRIKQIKEYLKTNEIPIHDTLKVMFHKKKETWKRNLIQVYIITNYATNDFTNEEISKYLGFNKRWFDKQKKELFDRGLISVKRASKKNGYFNRYSLTTKGVITAESLIEDWKKNHEKEYENLIKETLNYY